MLRLAALAVVALALVPAAAAVAPAPSPERLQARYDVARDLLEKLPPGDVRLRRARAELAIVERWDGRPANGRPVLPRLPRTAGRVRGEQRTHQALEDRLEALGQAFHGWAAFWVHDLSTGRTAGWNSDARFPAASTVKLGAMAAGLRRFGASRVSRVRYDVDQVAYWSSNLAANRLVEEVGGITPVYDALRGLGMTMSTYPGAYRAGTTLADAPKPPPIANIRVTTAHDLGRALYRLKATAAGNRYASRQTGLGRFEAGTMLALLRAAWPQGDNAGLLRPWLPGVAVAQKNGWLSDTRSTAGIVYFPEGPKIVVVLAWREGLTQREAQRLGQRVLALVRPR
jgi:hypothetical protein